MELTDNQNRKQLNQLIAQINNTAASTTNNHNDLFMHMRSNFGTDNKQCSLLECPILNRITSVLKRYNLLFQNSNKHNDDVEQEKAVAIYQQQIYGNSQPETQRQKNQENINNIFFFDDNYNNTKLLNDYNHLLFVHGSQFEDIYNTLIQKLENCDLLNCQILKRNHRNRSKFTAHYNLLKQMYSHSNDNKYDIVRQQLIDRIHCYYYHSFDIGYKIQHNILNNIAINDEDQKEMNRNDDVGIHFDKQVYQINKLIQSKRSAYDNIDGLQRLTNKNNKFIFQPQIIQTEEENNEIKDIDEKQQKETDSTLPVQYNYGKRFFYWDYYKDNDDVIDRADCMAHLQLIPLPVNADSTVEDWYVSKKYDNFKDELTNNNIYGIGEEQWDNLVIKAMLFMDTDHVREIVICPRTFTAKCYDMKEGTLMQCAHLIANMIYCNFDVLQFKFSETFRYNKNETNKELKERHRSYYFLARLLREMVECFGVKGKIWPEHISVWHGLNKNFTFATIFASIKGPLSTSTDYSVAASFCNNKGTIVNISIDTSGFCYEYNARNKETVFRQSMFDCQWINDYSNEQEIFVIGGLNRFDLETIVQVPSAQNFDKYIKGLRQMTTGMTTGQGSGADITAPATAEEKQMVFRLLSHELHRYYPNNPDAYQFNTCPPYVTRILHEHCKHIKQIVFRKEKKYQCIIHELLFKYDDGWIKIELLNNLFPNVERVMVTLQDKDISFFTRSTIYNSVLLFLKSKVNTKLQTIIVYVNEDTNYLSAVYHYIQSYKKEFKKYSWDINVKVLDNQLQGSGLDTVKKLGYIEMSR